MTSLEILVIALIVVGLVVLVTDYKKIRQHKKFEQHANDAIQIVTGGHNDKN